ncbi:rubredoxin [Mucilaginibacter rivuli]|uniref:rubredoxin n=1 Tax=Mucilaginibacter rivuli TaxID=2857527 RepID=UPI0021065F9F
MIKINLPGGIVPAGELLDILTGAQNANVTHVRFGNRQQLLFEVDHTELDDLKNELIINDINYEVDADEYPNIISSYVTEDIIYNANWLKEGVYKDILDLFDYEPRLKINLADNSQTFVPFFTGNFNFISSDVSNFWYLYVRFPKTNILYCWPSLIYSEDIPGISKIIEQEILGNRKLFYDQPVIDGALLHKKVTAKTKFLLQPYTHTLQLPEFHLPFYEGFNRYNNNKQWLGIYRRDELFRVDFLKEICALCLETRIGQLYTTPWKSIVIKGIEQADRKAWGTILNRYRINVRHAANELNWQVEDLCDEGLLIKRQLVREFEEADTRTYRLCFAVKTKRKSGLFGSVIINKLRSGSKGSEDIFEILHTRDFNPNSKDFVVFRPKVAKPDISTHLMALCDMFYELQDNEGNQPAQLPTVAEANAAPDKQVYQCKNCMTVYDEIYGDDINNIAPGTKFETIEQYQCPTCDSPKQDFVLLDSLSLAHQWNS